MRDTHVNSAWNCIQLQFHLYLKFLFIHYFLVIGEFCTIYSDYFLKGDLP